jgi:hypothetical protein
MTNANIRSDIFLLLSGINEGFYKAATKRVEQDKSLKAFNKKFPLCPECSDKIKNVERFLSGDSRQDGTSCVSRPSPQGLSFTSVRRVFIAVKT